MKKIISLIAAASVLLVSVVSCNIETSRSYSGEVIIEVTNLPDSVKALSFWGTPNEWKAANIEDSDYIVKVEDGKAKFTLEGYNFSTTLWCQFVPMTSEDMALNDSTWWQTAFSGSSEYANAENNLVYDFTPDGASSDPMTLTLDVKAVYGDVSNVFNTRFTTGDYQTALKKTK